MAPAMRIFIGLAEVAGGAGLILPQATKIMPQLTLFAAAGLALLMVGASGFHLARVEYAGVVSSLIMAALLLLVIYIRRDLWNRK